MKTVRWSLINESSRPMWEVDELFRFAMDEAGGFRKTGAVKVRDALWRADSRDGFAGTAGQRGRQLMPRWAGRASYSIHAVIASDEWPHYGQARVCWHSTAAKRMSRAIGIDAVYVHCTNQYKTGARRWGQWPIFVANDWREGFLHLIAHELGHAIEYDRDRKVNSEIFCEQFAERVLNAYRDRKESDRVCL